MDIQMTRSQAATVPNTKKVEIKIPAGISPGKKLRVPNKGHAGANGRAGDLFVIVNIARHPLFRIVGENLETEIGVHCWQAALGGDIRVPTLSGAVTMKIPAGSASGQTLRLANQGMTRLSGGKSDLMVKLKITVPKVLSPEQKSLFEQLAKTDSA
jgi:DnaJ-class molecular chaperone